MYIDVNKVLNDAQDSTAVMFDKTQEQEISTKAIEKCLDNPDTYTIVRDNHVKKFLVDKVLNYIKNVNREDIEQIVKTQYEVYKHEEFNELIILFLDYEISKKITEFHKGIKVISFVYDSFLSNRNQSFFELEKNKLTTSDFKDAIRTAMNYSDDEYLIEIKTKSLEEEPVVYYKGELMNVDNFTGLDYGFRYEDEIQGKHYLNIELDDKDGLSKIIKHL